MLTKGFHLPRKRTNTAAGWGPTTLGQVTIFLPNGLSIQLRHFYSREDLGEKTSWESPGCEAKKLRRAHAHS